jgi:hypothetical protein
MPFYQPQNSANLTQSSITPTPLPASAFAVSNTKNYSMNGAGKISKEYIM